MPAGAIKAIDLFPYWADNRALLTEVAGGFEDADLDTRPAPGFASAGEMLRHVITTEEHWWHGGILGEPGEQWRPAGWSGFTVDAKHAYRRERFPTVATIVTGLRHAHAPVEAWLREVAADDLCEKRLATWGEQNTLRWMLWHLVEHDQHHRAQLSLRARTLGRIVPQIWPRPAAMAWTPAAGWRGGDVDIADVVPFWKPLHAATRKAVAALSDADLGFARAPGRPTIHDIVLHLFIGEDFLVRQAIGGEMGTDRPPIEAGFWKVEVAELSRRVGPAFPTVASLLGAMDGVHGTTRRVIAGLQVRDLARRIEISAGPETVHHLLWYAREHAVHHRAQLFFQMRLAGRTPPSL